MTDENVALPTALCIIGRHATKHGWRRDETGGEIGEPECLWTRLLQEQPGKNIVGAVLELDLLDIREARRALDADDRRHAIGNTQTVIGVIAREDGGVTID